MCYELLLMYYNSVIIYWKILPPTILALKFFYTSSYSSTWPPVDWCSSPRTGWCCRKHQVVPNLGVIIIIIIIIIKKDWQCKAGRRRLTPYQSEDPSPTLPTYRGKEGKRKIVEDKKGESNYANKNSLDLLLKPTIEYGVNQIVPERYWEGIKVLRYCEVLQWGGE